MEPVGVDRVLGDAEMAFREFLEETLDHPLVPRQRIAFNCVLAVSVLGKDLFIEWIQSLIPEKGNAGKVMTFLCALADKHKVRLVLDAIPCGEPRIPKRKLMAFYRRYGFRWTKEDEMVREVK